MPSIPLASASAALSALPRPIVHIKGYRGRLLLEGAADPPFALTMRAQAECKRERQKAKVCASLVMDAIVAMRARTLAFDGDAPDSTGFTAIIPLLLAKLPGLHLTAFCLDDWGAGCEAAWSPVLSALPEGAAPVAFTIFLVPPMPPETIAEPDDQYLHLGRTALQSTGSRHAFCLGGGDVTAREAASAPDAFFVAAARRWVAPEDAIGAAGAPLRMEDASVASVAGVTLLGA